EPGAHLQCFFRVQALRDNGSWSSAGVSHFKRIPFARSCKGNQRRLANIPGLGQIWTLLGGTFWPTHINGERSKHKGILMLPRFAILVKLSRCRWRQTRRSKVTFPRSSPGCRRGGLVTDPYVPTKAGPIPGRRVFA